MAVSLDLPPHVRALLAERLDGVARTDLSQRAAAISTAYRGHAASSGVISDPLDALAYAVVRMPATYAAVRRALARAGEHIPALAPQSLLDVGSGPGTASLAAMAQWPSVAAATLLEQNRDLANFAGAAVAATGADVRHVAQDAADARKPWPAVDAVVASYVLVELAPVVADKVVARMAETAHQVIVLVEPGTMAGFMRIRRARDQLITNGWAIAAPCPHDGACPLASDDWCHFSVRVARSRDHKLVKGADSPFEDEPYSYVVATRLPVARAGARILRAPVVAKATVELKLCGAGGTDRTTVTKSDRERFKVVRKAAAGDPF